MKRRVLSLFLALTMLCTLIPQVSLLAHAETLSGTCGAEGDGSNLTWTLDTETGLLTIEGSGAMRGFVQNNWTLWYEYRDLITAVSLPDGLTIINTLCVQRGPDGLRYHDCGRIFRRRDRRGQSVGSLSQRLLLEHLGQRQSK